MREAAIGEILSRGTAAFAPAVCPLPVWKRGLDILLIIVLLPGLLIASAVAVMIIKLSSPGPLLFSQERVGYRGRRFRIHKFRTMHTGADTRSHQNHVKMLIASGGAMAKLDAKNDPRVIPMGGVLRATGMDELPQVWNIIRGEMSFVGPRPCVPYEYEQYEPHHRARLNAVPGLTGLWQVNGKNRTTFERMVELDVEYSRRCSLWMDLSIILRTFGALVGQCKDLRERRKAEESRVLAGVRSCDLQKS